MIREENGVQIITLTVPGGEVSVVPHFYFIFSKREKKNVKRSINVQLGVKWEPGPFKRGCRIRKYCKKSDYSRGFLELDGRVPVGAELDSINGHNVKSSKYEKIISFFKRRDVARFKLGFRISSMDVSRPQRKEENAPSRPVVDHQIRSEKLDVATHRRSVKQKFKMAIRRWRLTKDRGSTYVEYEVVCALKTGDSIKRWTVWKRYVASCFCVLKTPFVTHTTNTPLTDIVSFEDFTERFKRVSVGSSINVKLNFLPRHFLMMSVLHLTRQERRL